MGLVVILMVPESGIYYLPSVIHCIMFHIKYSMKTFQPLHWKFCQFVNIRYNSLITVNSLTYLTVKSKLFLFIYNKHSNQFMTCYKVPIII